MFKFTFISLIFVLAWMQLYSNFDTLNYKIDTLNLLSADSSALLESVYFEDTLGLKAFNKLNYPGFSEDVLRNAPAIAMLDSLVNIKFFNDEYFITDTAQLNVYRYGRDVTPQFSDSVYEARITYLNGQTPFELTFNTTVKNLSIFTR